MGSLTQRSPTFVFTFHGALFTFAHRAPAFAPLSQLLPAMSCCHGLIPLPENALMSPPTIFPISISLRPADS